MPTRKEFQNLCNLRLKEVDIIYKNQFYDGAMYLSAYIVETALKARICRILDSNYPERDLGNSFLIHKFENLLKLGGLKKKFDNDCATNIKLKTNWSLLAILDVELRYEPPGRTKKAEVEQILEALLNKDDGILTWIKKRW